MASCGFAAVPALLSEPAMRAVRGNEIGMIFQEPMSSLNPLLTVGERSPRSCGCIRASAATAGGGCWRA